MLNPSPSIDDIDTFVKLGLTDRQARVYLSLLKIGPSKAEAISSISSVHRPEVYRVAANLQKLGLIEVHVSSPTIFSATSISESVKILTDLRTKELQLLRDKTEKLVTKFKNIIPLGQTEEAPNFVLSNGQAHYQRLRDSIDKCNERLDFILNWKQARQVFYGFRKNVCHAIKKGIEVRVITEQSHNELFAEKMLEIPKLKLLKIRSILNTTAVSMVLFDRTEFAICTNPQADLKGLFMWSSNIPLVSLGNLYFDTLWSSNVNLNSCANNLMAKRI